MAIPLCAKLNSHDQEYIAKFLPYKDMIIGEVAKSWPDLTYRSMIPSQIQQETCASAKSKMCWSPHAELKTPREYGFGWGQLTITPKFDNFKEAKKLDKTLASWAFEDRYNVAYQLRTMILMDKLNYGKFSLAADEKERMAFSFAAYNGGLGGVLSDKAVCRNTSECDPNRWFDHVEHTSKKAKVPVHGYGQSFFQINRTYTNNIVNVFPPRYMPFFGECNVR